MSAAGRGAVRRPADYYPTPAWCTRRLLEALDLPGGRWLEPSAGDGAIVRAAARADVEWTACELREECRAPLEATGATVRIGDFLAGEPDEVGRFAVAVLNPPFSHALPFVQRSMAVAGWVAALARLNWLEGGERAGWLREHAPDVLVLPNRPSFTGTGTDATAYAWLVWPPDGHNRASGLVRVLAPTSREERRAVLAEAG